jgi:hypothetical protein
MRHQRPYNSAQRSRNRYVPEELDHEYHPTAEIPGFRTGRAGARGSRLRRSCTDFELPRAGAARVGGSAGDTRHHSSSASSATPASSSRRPHRGACASSQLRGACSGSSRRGPACASCRRAPPFSAAPRSRYFSGRRRGRRPGQQRCPQRRRWQRLTAARPGALCDRTTPPRDPGRQCRGLGALGSVAACSAGPGSEN